MTYTNFLDSREEEEEATNDYSSYWQSIPDPPVQHDTAAALENNIAVDITDPVVDNDSNTSVAEAAEPRRRNNKRKDAFRDVTNRNQTDEKNKRGGTAAANTANNNLANGRGEESDGTVEVVGGGSGDIIDNRKSKKRKKRRSMLLPSDSGEGTVLPFKCLNNNNHDNIATASKSDDEFTAINSTTNNINNKEILIKLVRDYCTLPPGECRVNSTEAKQIESISSYPMPGKILPFMNMNNSNNNSRQDFLLKIQPIVQEMEYRKQQDVEETRVATQCEVKKNSSRGGGYCYYDVNSGKEVMPDEYKKRYAAMVRDKRKKRQCVRVMNGNELEECSGEDESTNQQLCSLKGRVEDKEVDPHNMNKHNICDDYKSNEQQEGECDDSNMSMDESVNMDESMMSRDDSVLTRGEEDGDEKKHPSIDSTAAIKLPLEVSNCTSTDEVTSESSNAEENNSPDSHPLLGGMPTSNDPRVQAARQTLWRAIDTALANYSREILNIERGVCDGGGEANETALS